MTRVAGRCVRKVIDHSKRAKFIPVFVWLILETSILVDAGLIHNMAFKFRTIVKRGVIEILESEVNEKMLSRQWVECISRNTIIKAKRKES